MSGLIGNPCRHCNESFHLMRDDDNFETIYLNKNYNDPIYLHLDCSDEYMEKNNIFFCGMCCEYDYKTGVNKVNDDDNEDDDDVNAFFTYVMDFQKIDFSTLIYSVFILIRNQKQKHHVAFTIVSRNNYATPIGILQDAVCGRPLFTRHSHSSFRKCIGPLSGFRMQWIV